MNPLTLFTTLLGVTLSVRYVSSTCVADGINVEDLITRYVAVDEKPFWSGDTGDIFGCATSCIRRKICNSFNFNDYNGDCDLLTGLLTSSSPTKKGLNFMWSNISDWPAADLDPHCSSRPCNDIDVCFPGHLTSNLVAGTCGYSCIPQRIVCPMPTSLSGGREVGDVNNFTCSRGFVGGDSAECLPNQEWSKQIDFSCAPLLSHGCSDSNFCAEINAKCIEGKCVCGANMVYSTPALLCIPDCGTPPVITNAGNTGTNLQRTYECETNYIMAPDSNTVINCTETGWTSLTLSCYNCGSPPVISNAGKTGDNLQQTYECETNYIMAPDSNTVINCTETGWTSLTLSCYNCPLSSLPSYANVAMNGIVGTLTCKEPGTVPTTFSNDTIECTSDGTWKPHNSFFCFGVRLSGGSDVSGVVEVYTNQSRWISLMEKSWTYENTKVLCQMINPAYIFGGTHHPYEDNTFPSVLTKAREIEFDCKGTEHQLSECVKGSNDADDDHDKDFDVTCFTHEVSKDTIRLSGTPDQPMWGRLEVKMNGVWGTVCASEDWDDKDADQACKSINQNWKRDNKNCNECGASSHTSLNVLMNRVQCEDHYTHFQYCPMSYKNTETCGKEAEIKCKLE